MKKAKISHRLARSTGLGPYDQYSQEPCRGAVSAGRAARAVALAGFALALAGCALAGPGRGAAALAELERGHGLRRELLSAGRFRVLALRRGRGARLHVYLEGDGRAWARHRRVARDPTPRDPIAARLAAADPAPAVAYLARPCQFGTASTAPCSPRYWSSHRYAPEVIAGLDQALDALADAAGARRLVLIGYSGGGTVAALLAARRPDVVALITVAANLDHRAWTRLHGDSPLTGSLNPGDRPEALAGLPQVHLAGAEDRNVPPALARGFVERLGTGAPADLLVVPGFDHRCCWARDWPRLLATALARISASPAPRSGPSDGPRRPPGGAARSPRGASRAEGRVRPATGDPSGRIPGTGRPGTGPGAGGEACAVAAKPLSLLFAAMQHKGAWRARGTRDE